MSSSRSAARRLLHGAADALRRATVAACVLAAVAGCTTAIATPALTAAPPNPTPTLTAVPPTPTPTLTAVPPTPTPTLTAVPPNPTPTLTAAPPNPTANLGQVLQVPTPAPTVPKVKLTAPPEPGDGLCKSEQLSLSITAWIGDVASTTVYAHLTARNVSSTSCKMRGTSEVQILNGSGAVIADAGASAARASTGDPSYALTPGGTINTIAQWSNWCGSAPSQNVKVAMVEPFGLGRIVAPATGAAPVPACGVSGSTTMVSSEAWLP